MERKEIHELHQPTLGKHSSCIIERSIEQEDECHKTRSTLTPWRRVNKSPPSPFKTKTIMKILKIMKGAQELSRILRSGEQKDAPITKAHSEISKRRQAIHKHNQLSKRSFHKVVWYHHPSNDKDTL
jgi:hypothetical protein